MRNTVSTVGIAGSSVAIYITLTLLASLVSCSRNTEQDVQQKPRVTVQVATARIGTIENYLTVPGSTEALRIEKIRAPITGKIAGLHLLEGDCVQKGEVLLTLVPMESHGAILGARQLLERARSESQRKEAQSALQLAEETAPKVVVVAPFSGAIATRFVNDGEYVNAGSDLIEVMDTKSIYFVADVPLRFVSNIRPGLLAMITFPAEQIAVPVGRVTATNPQVNSSSQNVKVRIAFERAPDALKVGMFGTASIKIGEHHGALLVPQIAVYHNDELNNYSVLRIQGDTLALLTQVQVGLMDSTSTEIIRGLSPGDKVVTVGNYGLPDSTLVTVR
jgi:multidrug efflux system membrane fusion protein